ncbi:MAG: chromosome segregation protein SMC [Phycisphaerae bacterium]|nr:chromosome segregation protein SMC [Phycisphaerae bacterium]
MHLKRLTLTGFKSFVDKTDFDFAKGITCVVGPNGCGKSNIVDAIKWVLGEQSAKSLRGRQMLDVIFNGSSARRSSGMAQVDLVFDNSAPPRLPMEQAEVVISRRLYRSGESEYLLNKQPARLKDIRELFMDTGVGAHAYSIIEQGKVDTLLQASPTERRIIFEEAAGISKYKARRKEAVRRLDRVDQNLLRVQDIIDEVEKRLRSIKYQAGKARNYQAYSERLRELRASFSLAEYHRLTSRTSDLERGVAGETDTATELRGDISRIEAEMAELESKAIEFDREIAQLDNELLTTQSRLTGNQERVDQFRQRMQELESNLTRVRERRVVEQRRIKDVTDRLGGEQAKVSALEQRANAQAELIATLMGEDQQRSRELTELQARMEDEKAGILELLRRTAQLHNEIQGLDLHRDNLLGQKERLNAREAEIRRRLEDVLTRKAQFEGRGREISEVIESGRARLEEKKQAAAVLDETRSRLDHELATAKESRSGLRSQYDLLRELDERYEGVSAGARAILMAKEADPDGPRYGYVEGLVAELLSADVNHASIIESALGDLEQYLVVSNSSAMFDDEEMIAGLNGCVRTICLDRLGPVINARDFSGMPGFVGNAADMVQCDDRHRYLARHLLGKTVIVRTLPDALRLAEVSYGSYRFIALTGEIIEPDGRVILGPSSPSVGLISRKSQIRELAEQIEQTDERIAMLADRLTRTSAEFEHLERVQQDLRTAIYEATIEQTENNGNLQQVGEEIRRLTEEQPLIAGEVEAIERQVNEAIERSSASQDRLKELEAIHAEGERAVEQLKDRIDQAVAERQQLAERLTEARIEAGRLSEQRASLTEHLLSLQQERHRAEANLLQADHDVIESEGRLVSAERAILRAEASLAGLYLDKERAHRNVLGCRRQRELSRAATEELARQLKVDRQELQVVDDRLGELRLQLQEARVRRDELIARVRDELDIDLAEQYQGYEATEQDWSAVESEIHDLRSKIDRLGNVNLDAIAEQEELEQRAGFLTGQRDDLVESKKSLESLIQRLNKECRDRFLENFETIRKHFQDLYRKLFGGGRADIILEDPNDVLECGIEIVARPPGKELQSISLLSGGEKTMTAVALLLGIFKSRPSPFALLDEVDAALDEANNERFNKVVQEFLEHSQFVVITHSKRTMSVADAMYGVTMQEPGVSKRVAVRFENQVDSTAAVA